MATPITNLKIKTPTGIVDVPIYNVGDVLDSSYRIMTNAGLGCFDLVSPSTDTSIRVMTHNGVKGINLVQNTPIPISPNVRYVRDWIGGNTTNNFRTWCEVQAIDMNGVNVALGKTVTHSAPVSGPFYNPQETNDGIIDAVGTNGSGTDGPSGEWDTPMFVQIDLGSVIKLSAIKVWHDYSDGRTYQHSHLEVSEDGVAWTTLFDSEVNGRYVETATGKTHILSTDPLNQVIVEDFLDDSYAFAYTQGTYPWNRFNGASLNGNLGYIKSSNQGIADSASNITFEIVEVPIGNISSRIEVDYSVDSEADCDFLIIYLDGVVQLNVAGRNLSGTISIPLTGGPQYLQCTFQTDTAISEGTDSGYVSEIRLFINE